MRNKFAERGSYINGCPVTTNSGWLAMVMDDVAVKEIDHTAVMSWRDTLLSPRFMKMFRTVAVLELPDTQVIFIGDNGHCLAVSPNGQAREEFVSPGPDTPKNTGHLRAATVVGATVIAVGMQRQVYLRTPDGHWSPWRNGLPPLRHGETSGFEAVAAVSQSEVYAAGWGGEIWHLDGLVWNRVDSPTSRIITALGVDDSGSLVGCGRSGLLISGRLGAWQVLSETKCPDDLWSIAPYGPRIFAAGLFRLYCIEDESIRLVDLDSIDVQSFGVLTLNNGLLWSIGEKDVVSYDGTDWSRIA